MFEKIGSYSTTDNRTIIFNVEKNLKLFKKYNRPGPIEWTCLFEYPYSHFSIKRFYSINVKNKVLILHIKNIYLIIIFVYYTYLFITE